MLAKIVHSYCARFDNLLAQTFIVSMRININTTDTEEIQSLECMAATNYCSTFAKDKTTSLFRNLH